MPSKATSRCVYQRVAGDPWETLCLGGGALDLCAGRCDQNATENKQSCPALWLQGPPCWSRAMLQGNIPNAGWVRGSYGLPENPWLQICKHTNVLPPSTPSKRIPSLEIMVTGDKNTFVLCLWHCPAARTTWPVHINVLVLALVWKWVFRLMAFDDDTVHQDKPTCHKPL